MEISKSHKEIIKLALYEDLAPHGDLSSLCLGDSALETCQAQVYAREPGLMVCSELLEVILELRKELYFGEENYPQAEYQITFFKNNGNNFQTDEMLFSIEAPAWLILSSERTILNFYQRLLGIAKTTQRFLERISNSPSKLLDTRKSSPGLRHWEKLAFRQAGGTNHRMGLSDMIMLKENHLATIFNAQTPHTEKQKALELIKKYCSTYPSEVEINEENLMYLEEILALPISRIMLDNFSVSNAQKWVYSIKERFPKLELELSGGINLDNISDYASANPDFISVGASFTQARNLDLSMISNLSRQQKF